MFGVVADHEARQGLPIVARATPEELDMLGESGMQDIVQPVIFKGDADDRSEESIISLGGGDTGRPLRWPEVDTRDRSEKQIINLGGRDAEHRRRPPKSGIKSRFGFNVVGRFRRSKVSQTIL